jgi:hypothetical protein
MNAGVAFRQLWWRAISQLSLASSSRASRRGVELLKANLTPDQLHDFLTYRRFDVVGGVTGRTYRIRFGGTMNVKELHSDGSCVRRLCFLPEGQLVNGDVVLAQKVALEAFETEALAVANKLPMHRSMGDDAG